MKNKIMLILITLLCFPIIVFAGEGNFCSLHYSKQDGNFDDIEECPTASYNQSTHTLTLDNFYGALSISRINSDFNIIMHGNVVIGSRTNSNGIAIYSEGNINISGDANVSFGNEYATISLYTLKKDINISGITLNLSKISDECGINATTASYIPSGYIVNDYVPTVLENTNINIENAKIIYKFTEPYGDISPLCSRNFENINIKNTKIDAESTNLLYPIFLEGKTNINIDNSELNLKGNFDSYAIGSEGNITISNSKLDIKSLDEEYYNNGQNGIVSENKISINDSTINLNSLEYGIAGHEVEMNNSTVNTKRVSFVILDDELRYESEEDYLTLDNGNKITVKNSSIDSDGSRFLVKGNSVIVDNSNLTNYAVNVVPSEEIACDGVLIGAFGKTLKFLDSKIRVGGWCSMPILSKEELKLSSNYKATDNYKIVKSRDLGEEVFDYPFENTDCYAVIRDASYTSLLEFAKNNLFYDFTLTGKTTYHFNANGGSGTMNQTDVATFDKLPISTFTPPKGKQFKGWSLSENGELISSEPNDMDVTLYAIWEDIPKEKENPNTGAIISVAVILGLISLGTAGIAISTHNRKFN